MKKSIDGRTLPCPQPVIKVKQAFDEGGFSQLEVLVDNKAAVENIKRFVENSGNSIISLSEEEDMHTILIENSSNSSEPETEPEETLSGSEAPKGATNIFINSETVGSGDDKLGRKLMEAFIYSLTEIDDKPAHILMMNGGVKCAVEGSPSIDNLRDLAESGVDILVCGACLDFFGSKEKLQVGRISNMYEIASVLTGGGNTVTVG